jgi:adenylyltransferase and sulfurtransferase
VCPFNGLGYLRALSCLAHMGKRGWFISAADATRQQVSVHGGGRKRETIEGELERLRAEREELDGRIRLLESQLDGLGGEGGTAAGAEAGDRACGLGGACPRRGSNGFEPNGRLPADMIHRYIRHLLLHDFGVEG